MLSTTERQLLREGVTVQDAGHKLNLTEQGVRKRIRLGQLSATKINGSWVIPKSALRNAPAYGHRRKRSTGTVGQLCLRCGRVH